MCVFFYFWLGIVAIYYYGFGFRHTTSNRVWCGVRLSHSPPRKVFENLKRRDESPPHMMPAARTSAEV